MRGSIFPTLWSWARAGTTASMDQPDSVSHRFQMRVAPLVEVLVGVTHGLRLAAPQHDLEIDRLETIVLVAVDDAGGALDAFPPAQAGGGAFSPFLFPKQIEITPTHEKAILD